jgi:type II secretory pathway predicted ATPase ExeA
MYASFFGLSEAPFNITPDPRFLYLNGCYQEALAALTYGIDARKGFITVVGEAGTGKTTLLRRLLDSVAPSTRTVLLLNPTVSFDEILEHILIDLGIPTDGGKKLVLLQRLNEFLLEHTRAGGNVALLIDEAQDLQMDVLEELRLLSNLETAREKILQIVLAGQPELETKLEDPSIRQLRQRITMPIRIRTLSPAEVGAYIRTRLERVGGTDPDLFAPEAIARIAEFSEGIPRLVNVLCDASLLATFVAERRQVTPALVEEAWADFAPRLPRRRAEPAAAAESAPAAEPEAPVSAPEPAAGASASDVGAAPGDADEPPAEPSADAAENLGAGSETDVPAEPESVAAAADAPAAPKGKSVRIAAALALLLVAAGAGLLLRDRKARRRSSPALRCRPRTRRVRPTPRSPPCPRRRRRRRRRPRPRASRRSPARTHPRPAPTPRSPRSHPSSPPARARSPPTTPAPCSPRSVPPSKHATRAASPPSSPPTRPRTAATGARRSPPATGSGSSS